MANVLKRISNYFFPTPDVKMQVVDQRKEARKTLSNFITPVQFQRIRHDIFLWREAIGEAENAWYPHRVKMQRLFQDTILNGHVYACLDKRRKLTLLKDFGWFDEKGKEIEDLTKMFKEAWFNDLSSYILDANFFGYSLLNFKDIINGKISGVELVRRHNVSPDRLQVTSYVYSLDGINFLIEDWNDWVIWVPTTSETGVSKCGYGLLYKVAYYEIFCRNLTGFNGDFVELFAQPYRIGKTTKTEDDERSEFAATLRDMGSNGWALIDPNDEIEMLESKLGGSGYQGYDNFEKRLEAKISKIILGHADAMDSVPGKLGGQQNEDNPVEKALRAVEITDNNFLCSIVNDQLKQKLIALGFSIPENAVFKIKNNEETEEIAKKEAANAKIWAETAQTLNNAGLKMTPEFFTEKTGVPVEKVEVEVNNKDFNKEITAKLRNWYAE